MRVIGYFSADNDYASNVKSVLHDDPDVADIAIVTKTVKTRKAYSCAYNKHPIQKGSRAVRVKILTDRGWGKKEYWCQSCAYFADGHDD